MLLNALQIQTTYTLGQIYIPKMEKQAIKIKT